MKMVFAYALAVVFAAIAVGIFLSGSFDDTIVAEAPEASSSDVTAIVPQSPTTTPASPLPVAGTDATTSTEKIKVIEVPKSPKNPVNKPYIADSIPVIPATSTAVKAASPYSTPAESFENVEKELRGALVNILCMPQGGTLRPISGSGVVISPDGVILTNAHVAQYVLLSEDLRINLSCSIRSGSPAESRWKAAVLYMPKVWVDAHFQELNKDHVSGTGEHDYALLKIVSDAAGNPFSGTVPHLPLETRENIAFEGDPVLVAGYPAEFVGGLTTQQSLYASISPTTIRKLLTFDTGTIDVFSLGGVLQAQGGASGGPVVNAWHHVVGLIVTTSAGATTADRDLHALNLNYIERDFTGNTGLSLEGLLATDSNAALNIFTRNIAPLYIEKYLSIVSH